MFRYTMGGSFTPGIDTFEVLGIECPSPYSWNTEQEAYKDASLAYRFGYRDGEVVLLIFPRQGFTTFGENAWEWVDGQPLIMREPEFRKKGGLIYTYPDWTIFHVNQWSEQEMQSAAEAWLNEVADKEWNVEDYEVTLSFKELFPNMDACSEEVYISNESYAIYEVGQ